MVKTLFLQKIFLFIYSFLKERRKVFFFFFLGVGKTNMVKLIYFLKHLFLAKIRGPLNKEEKITNFFFFFENKFLQRGKKFLKTLFFEEYFLKKIPFMYENFF